MKNILILLLVLVLFTSCFESAKVRFADGTTSVIDHMNLLEDAEIGDTLFLEKSGMTWEIDNEPLLENYNEGVVYYEPWYDRDSVRHGGFFIRYAKAVVVKK